MASNPSALAPSIEYLIRFVQIHETFRKPELDSLAILAGVQVEFLDYNDSSPYSTIRLYPHPSTPNAARALIHRSISSKSIHELWGTGTNYATLHADIHRRSSHLWPLYKHATFRFDWDAYHGGSRSLKSQLSIIEGFSYLGFEGPIRMKGAEEVFTIFEEYGLSDENEGRNGAEGEAGETVLKRVFLGRLVGDSERERGVLGQYTLKKRQYINTTSMDSELAFLTANIALAAEGKLFYDPFVGTGSFPIACAHFGARCWGSDIDGRMVRGREVESRAGEKRDIRTNFRQYGLLGHWMDGFVADLTNSPLRMERWLDGIVCDPPYGVREGLKVLGHKDGRNKTAGEALWIDGKPAHLREGYIPPRKPYSLEAMLDDILRFAARTLVDEARVSLWMPTANDLEEEMAVPEHPALELLSVCVQVFNKWSRRLLTYRRIPGVDAEKLDTKRETDGTTADELNGFRKRYFQGFRNLEQTPQKGQSVALPDQGEDDARLVEIAETKPVECFPKETDAPSMVTSEIANQITRP